MKKSGHREYTFQSTCTPAGVQDTSTRKSKILFYANISKYMYYFKGKCQVYKINQSGIVENVSSQKLNIISSDHLED
jgi:hypothetical protein